jgi:cytochrome c-type biogenesis protein CcmE
MTQPFDDPATSPSKPPKARRNRVAMAAVAVVVLVLVWLVWGGIDKNIVYFLTPSELLAKGTDGYDRPVRLGGLVAANTVDWKADALDLRFDVTDGQKTVKVHSRGAPPQMFRAGIGVVLEGRYRRDGVFESSSVMVKHSNEYKPPHAGERPEELYKTLVKDGGPK